MISKAIKFLAAMVMLPLLPPLALGIWRRAGEFNAHLLFLENPLAFCLEGLVLWIFFALLFRFPARAYVMAHELTHALFVKLCGGQVKKISVKSDRGFVVSDRSNFLIALAPYLFPFYAVAWGLLGLLAIFWVPFTHWQEVFWIGFGFCLGYHWTMTSRMLTTYQTDFTSQGYFFSFVLIAITNCFILLLVLLALPSPGQLLHRLALLGGELARSYVQVFRFFKSWFH